MVLLQQLEQDMQPISSYSTLQNSFRQGVNSTDIISIRNAILKPKSKAEAKRLGAKKHSDAEKRRRMRINGQYATLRTILPNLIKMDKASVLAETIRRVTELKKTVSELKAVDDGSACSSSMKECVFPGEVDKLSLGYCEGDKGLVKATLSCEDRPRLMSDLTRAVRSVKGRVVRAEMVTVGGRTKSVCWVQGLGDGNEGLGTLKRALKVVIHKPILRGSKKLRLTHQGSFGTS